MSKHLSILFAGSGEFGLPSLRRLRADGHTIAGVITQPDRPAGRGRDLTPTPIAQYAAGAGLPLIRTASINKEPGLAEADVLVVIAFGQKISEEVISRARLGSVNLHASLLPKYRGAAPINWAIMAGETETGNSIIRLAQKMDAGAVLGQSRVKIGEIETAGELHDRLADDGAELMGKIVSQLASGTETEAIQDESLSTLAPKLSRETAKIDWTRPADQIARKIRGLSPWPGTRVKLCDATGKEIGRLRLVRARAKPCDEGSRWNTGEITIDGTVQAGDCAVEILEVQPDGKRPMSLEDYRRGHAWTPGRAPSVGRVI